MKGIVLAHIFATLALCGLSPSAFAGSPSEGEIKSHAWGKDTLTLDMPHGGTLQLLVTNGSFAACNISSAQGGGAAILNNTGKPADYGCWWSIQRKSDDSAWIKLQMDSGIEMLTPLTAFKKQPLDLVASAATDLWSEAAYQDTGRRISEHIRDVNHRIKVLNALVPTLDDQQKAAATECLKATMGQMQQDEHTAEVVQQEHEKFQQKWAESSDLTDAQSSEKRDDLGVVIDMANMLAQKTYKLSSDLQQCLTSRHVPTP